MNFPDDKSLDAIGGDHLPNLPSVGPAHLCTESCGSRAARWFCAETLHHQADVASDELRRQGFGVFRPMVWERRIKNRKVVRVECDMFAGYIFVLFDPHRDPWGAIAHTRGMRDAPPLGMTAGKPTPLPQELIAFVAANATERNAEFEALARASFNGAKVLVTKGPWRGSIGDCLMHRGDRVRLLLKLFGRDTHVEMPAERVERIKQT